jgi:hypothetical protein
MVLMVLIILHAVDGHEITINPEQITAMRPSNPTKPNEYLVDGVNCMINQTDGRYVSVAETCEQVRAIIEGKRR